MSRTVKHPTGTSTSRKGPGWELHRLPKRGYQTPGRWWKRHTWKIRRRLELRQALGDE